MTLDKFQNCKVPIVFSGISTFIINLVNSEVTNTFRWQNAALNAVLLKAEPLNNKILTSPTLIIYFILLSC